jgi:hypothetical protein
MIVRRGVRARELSSIKLQSAIGKDDETAGQSDERVSSDDFIRFPIKPRTPRPSTAESRGESFVGYLETADKPSNAVDGNKSEACNHCRSRVEKERFHRRLSSTFRAARGLRARDCFLLRATRAGSFLSEIRR